MKANYLPAKQQLFCDEYLIDRNSYRAALRAGYKESTAKSGQLMTFPKIMLYIQERTTEAAQKARVNREDVVSELCKIAFANVGNYYTEGGNLKPMHQLTPDEKAAIWQAKTGADGTESIKTYNKLVALEKLAKILNLYTHEVKQPEKEVRYVDTDEVTDDDYFEDEELKAEHNVFIDENGKEIYGNGMLPYGPVCDIFNFTIYETPRKLVQRLRNYRKTQIKMQAIHNHTTADFTSHLNQWLDAELLPHNCIIPGTTDDDILEKYTKLRDFKRKVDIKMAG